ncbi:MAG: glutathione peroxidase [Gammaproteobacteria bacterium]|nr:glutathione peroxidase [Gammaproteobacteria bacterium]
MTRLTGTAVTLAASILLAVPVAATTAPEAGTGECPAVLAHTLPRLHSSETLALCSYAGRALVVVNTASYCGFTGQFAGLEALWQARQHEDLVVLGFPSNDFRQEDDDESVTAEVCYINYGVSFPMLAPSAVAHGEVNPVFAELQRQGASPPRWNFHKYVVDRQGRLVAEFGSRTTPDDPALQAAIDEALLR